MHILAGALGRDVEIHKGTHQRMREFYEAQGKEVNASRLRMATIPVGMRAQTSVSVKFASFNTTVLGSCLVRWFTKAYAGWRCTFWKWMIIPMAYTTVMIYGDYKMSSLSAVKCKNSHVQLLSWWPRTRFVATNQLLREDSVQRPTEYEVVVVGACVFSKRRENQTVLRAKSVLYWIKDFKNGTRICEIGWHPVLYLSMYFLRKRGAYNAGCLGAPRTYWKHVSFYSLNMIVILQLLHVEPCIVDCNYVVQSVCQCSSTGVAMYA